MYLLYLIHCFDVHYMMKSDEEGSGYSFVLGTENRPHSPGHDICISLPPVTKFHYFNYIGLI